VSPILPINEALADEQLRAREMVATDDGLTQPAFPLKFSEFEFGSDVRHRAAGSTPRRSCARRDIARPRSPRCATTE